MGVDEMGVDETGVDEMGRHLWGYKIISHFSMDRELYSYSNIIINSSNSTIAFN